MDGLDARMARNLALERQSEQLLMETASRARAVEEEEEHANRDVPSTIIGTDAGASDFYDDTVDTDEVRRFAMGMMMGENVSGLFTNAEDGDNVMLGGDCTWERSLQKAQYVHRCSRLILHATDRWT